MSREDVEKILKDRLHGCPPQEMLQEMAERLTM